MKQHEEEEKTALIVKISGHGSVCDLGSETLSLHRYEELCKSTTYIYQYRLPPVEILKLTKEACWCVTSWCSELDHLWGVAQGPNKVVAYPEQQPYV